MGALKDIIDLVTQLSTSVTDRKFAAELRDIQSMIRAHQSAHVTLHEQRISLLTENAKIKNINATQLQEINSLKQEIFDLKRLLAVSSG